MPLQSTICSFVDNHAESRQSAARVLRPTTPSLGIISITLFRLPDLAETVIFALSKYLIRRCHFSAAYCPPILGMTFQLP